MITIHHEKETDFSKNGYGAIDDYVMSQEVTWEMNGQFNAFLEYPAFLDKSKYLVNKNILRVPVPFMEDQLFRIYRVRKVLGFIQVEARHIFYDLMDNLIEDTNIVGKTGSQAIQQLLGATQYEHRFIGLSDISTSNNARMVRYNPVEALLDDSKANTFVSRWGGEIVRDNFLIRMARQMGTDRGVRIQHRKDLTAYIATIDESTVVTRIMPVGFDGLKLPELYIDSPLLDPDNPKIGVIRYENVKAAIGEYADDNGAVPLEEAYELLRNHTKAEFSNNHIDEPEMTVTVNFVTLHNTKEYADFAQLQEIHQGDVVRVSVPEEGFEITSRLVAFTSDPLQQNHYTSTTLGNHVYEFTSSTNSVSTLRNEVEALRESVVEVRQSANGKNQSFWGEADPNTLNLNAILGDTYFRSVGEEDVIYQYVEVDGERYWKEIINTANTSEVKKEVERVAEEAEKLADDITEAQQSADDAKRDAGLALTASEALEIITQETASQLSDTRGLLATVESNASEAWAKADGAVTQSGQALASASEAKSDAEQAKLDVQSALSRSSDALNQSSDALSKANNIPETINQTIVSRGLVDGVTVERQIDEATGEMKLAISEVSGQIPIYILGFVWDKRSDPVGIRTDYLQEYADLSDYELLSTEFEVTKSGFSSDITALQTNKLDTGTFTNFKTNEFDVTVDGFNSRISNVETNKLDGSTFQSFKTNEYQATVDGFEGSIEALETNKLDDAEFKDFKKNDYEITVEGFRSSIEHLNGAVPYFTVGIEWDKESNPLAIRTGYAQDSVDALEYERFTADYAIDKDGITSELSVLQSGKLDGADFTSFKTGEYTQTVNGLTGRLSNVETTKLDESEFTDFRSNEYEVTVDGFAASLERVEGQIPAVTMGVTWNKQSDPIMIRTGHTEDLANLEEFEMHKADYSQTISGINTSLSSKVNTSDFNSFKTNDYQATVNGIQGNISSLETTKLDGSTYSNFLNNQFKATAERAENTYTKVQTDGLLDNYVQTAKYEMDASGFRANLQEVNGKIPGYVMGVSWDKKESPTLYRTADTGGVGDYEFKALQAEYNFTKESWSTRLSQIENAGYATQSWSNQTFATPQSVSTQLQSYAKTTDLNGMVTETTLATKNFITAGSVDMLLTSYAKTGDVPTATQFNSLKNRYDSMEQVIGTDKDSVARAVMTSSLWETEVSKVIDDELEQEYKTVTSKVNVVDGSKGINNGEGTGEGRYFYFNNSDGVVEGTLSRNATYTLEFSTQSFDNKGNAITLQVKPYGTTEWQPIVTGQMTSGKQISTFTFKNNVFASSVSDYRLLIRSANGENVPYIWGFKLYKEVEVEVPIEGTNTGAISSKITQLYNMINLSVLGKDGAMSRIAMGEEGIQIDGKLLHITAKTYIDEAVIKSAMIDTLDASKITTGELNASLIRVVNLDANSIAGNEASFIRAMFSGTKSTLQITGSGVSILDNLGRSSTYLDSSGIEFSRQGVNLGKLEYVTNVADSGDLYNMHGFSMRPNRNSYFGVSYFPTSSATSSIRRFAVSGRTGNVYISGLIKPSEQQIYGINITWGTITGRGTNVRIMNHNNTGGIQINNGDLAYLTSGGWRSLNDRLG